MALRACKFLSSNQAGKRAIFIDTENEAEIMEYLTRSEKHKKKFQYLLQHILEGKKNTEIYDKENINEKCRDVTAMKFFKGGSNDRIYCKEISTDEGVFVIVAAQLHERKKSQKNSNREITEIEKVGQYEYKPTIPPPKVSVR